MSSGDAESDICGYICLVAFAIGFGILTFVVLILQIGGLF